MFGRPAAKTLGATHTRRAPLSLGGLLLILGATSTLALSPAPLAALSLAPQDALAQHLYEAVAALQPGQGLGTAGPLDLGLLNPGADIDASASTDGEDLAAPLADVTEFRAKDANLALDYHVGPFQALNATLAGVAAHRAKVLVCDLVHDNA